MKCLAMLVALSLVTGVGGASGVAAADDTAPLYACHVPAADTKIHASFKPDVSLFDLAVWVSGFTCKNVIYEIGVARHATKLTVISPTEMTPRQALQLFVDAVQAAGLVVDQKADTLVVRPGPGMPNGCPDVAEAGNDEQHPSTWEMNQAIHGVDATHVTVARWFLEMMFADTTALANGARIVPAVANGKPAGFKLYAIRPTSVLARLGFHNGDTVHAVNGVALESPDKVLDAYAKVRAAPSLQVDLVRLGKPLTLSISIAAGPADILEK